MRSPWWLVAMLLGAMLWLLLLWGLLTLSGH